MLPTEPIATALLLTTFGALLAISILFSRATERVGVPAMLLFLLIGMLAGSEGLGGIAFESHRFALRLGTTALVLILFDGGLNTPLAAVRQVAAPASLLASAGVLGTAGLVAWAAHQLGFPWPQAMLLGAVVSPTDAAAVYAVLRGSGIQLKRRVGATLEVESGLNDPLAFFLTAVLTSSLLTPRAGDGWHVVGELLAHVAIGGAAGVALGYLGRQVLLRFRLPTGGLYPALTLAIAFLAYGVPTLIGGSGFLAVYVAAVILGNAALPYRSGLLRVHDAGAWLSQIAMFLVLGLLVVPSDLVEVAPIGLGLALFLSILARPAIVALCLAPFRYPAREILYIGWLGLRGAVPIILATFPIIAGAPGAARIFNVVFFIVVVNALVTGGTVVHVTRWLGLESHEPPRPKAVLEIESIQPLRGELVSFFVEPALAVANVALAELPFPEGAAATLIVRGDELVAPRGTTVLLPGDHVYVFARPEDHAFIQLMFGRPEEE